MNEGMILVVIQLVLRRFGNPSSAALSWSSGFGSRDQRSTLPLALALNTLSVALSGVAWSRFQGQGSGEDNGRDPGRWGL